MLWNQFKESNRLQVNFYCLKMQFVISEVNLSISKFANEHLAQLLKPASSKGFLYILLAIYVNIVYICSFQYLFNTKVIVPKANFHLK